MVELDSRRKKARLQLVEPLEDDDLSCESGIYTDEPPTVAFKVGVQYPSAPRAFLCPLTLEIMFDPFVDAQGNAFERRAILKWLQTNKISPISRKPLRAGALVPNNSLRDIIHNYMGPDWVERKLRQITAEEKNQKLTRVKSGTFRSKIDTFLEGFSECKEVGGLKLRLNEEGSAAFRYDDVIIVLDVPHSTGTFHLYTRELLENPTSPIKDRMLELNFMQGETRGGCLSLKKHAQDCCEVVFSYNDRVEEITDRDFRNVLFNFVETAITLRSKLLMAEEEAQKA